jgi:hypothetical protein
VFNVRDRDNRIRNSERSFFPDEVLTTRGELEQRANQQRTAEAERAELERTFRMRREMLESSHKSEEAKIREEAKKEKERNRMLSENRKQEKNEAGMLKSQKEKDLELWEDQGAAHRGMWKADADKKCDPLAAENESTASEGRRRFVRQS